MGPPHKPTQERPCILEMCPAHWSKYRLFNHWFKETEYPSTYGSMKLHLYLLRCLQIYLTWIKDKPSLDPTLEKKKRLHCKIEM